MRLAGVLAASIVTAAATAPLAGAQAAATIGTHIVFSPPGQAVTYSDSQVTFQGTLETAAPSGQSPQVLPGEPVQVTETVGRLSLPIASVTTDANGQFTVSTTVPVPGGIAATFAGDATYRAGVGEFSAHRSATAAVLPARISFGPVAPAPAYSTVTVTGQVTMQLPDGSWVPSPYAPLRSLSGAVFAGAGMADANGQFTETIEADPGNPLQMYASDDGDDWSGAAFSPDLVVPLTTFPTRVQPVTPSEVRVSPSTALYTQVQYQDDTGQWQPDPGATAQISYEPGRCSGPPIQAATAVSDSSGDLAFHVPGYLVRGAPDVGCWQVTVPSAGAYLASQSIWAAVSAEVPTWLNNTKLRWSGRRARLTGTLDDAPGAGPLAGRTITIYREVGRIWRRVGSVKTGPAGGFSFSLVGRPRSYYQARYAGGALPAGDAAGGRYLAVSGKRIWYRG